MDTVLDYAGGVPSAASIKAAGHIGAVRYIAPDRTNGNLPGKPVHRPELDAFDEHHLKMAMVWQFGAGGSFEASDIRRGYEGGVADAKAAQAHLNLIHASGHPVFFAIDYRITVEEWNSTGVEYFRGAASVLGKQRVGIYGHSRVCHWAGPEDDVVAQVEPGRWLCWVTKGNSDGATGSDYAVLYQRIVDTKANPGPKVGGVTVDINDVYHPEWGWRALDAYQQPPRQVAVPGDISMRPNPGHRGDPLFLPELFTLWGIRFEEFDGWRNRGHGDFNKITHVMAHHTAGANTPPSLIAFGHSLLRGLLSQIHLARDGLATLTGAGFAYHAGAGSGHGIPRDAANWQTIGIEAVNAGDGSQPWTKAQMDAYRLICAAIGWYLGLTAEEVIGHKEWSAAKIDPNFSMPVFRDQVQDLIDNPPFLKNLEKNTMALDLTKRYQFRTPAGYYEGDNPGSGTLLDVFLNTDTHSWVARVNTEILRSEVADLKAIIEKQATSQDQLVSTLAELTVVLAKEKN